MNIDDAKAKWQETIYNRAQPEAKDLAAAENQVIIAIENGERFTKVLVPELTLTAQQETWAQVISKRFLTKGFQSKCFTEEVDHKERWFIYISGWAD